LVPDVNVLRDVPDNNTLVIRQTGAVTSEKSPVKVRTFFVPPEIGCTSLIELVGSIGR
jgi:hypothetical protein